MRSEPDDASVLDLTGDARHHSRSMFPLIKQPRPIALLFAVLAAAVIGQAAASEPCSSRLGATTQREASWPRTLFVSTSKGSTLLAPLACVLKPKGKPRLGKVCAARTSPTALRLSDLRVLKARGWRLVQLSPWGDNEKDLVLALGGGVADEKAPLFGFAQNARPRSVEPFGAAPPASSEAAEALATVRSRRSLETESLTLVARMDLNEDGQPEWLFYRQCVNEFLFELYDASLDLIAEYGHCGV